MIAADVLDRRADYARDFRNAQPFRHVAIDGFLDPALCRRVRDDFPGFEERHALNEMGQVGGKAARRDVRDISAVYRELDQYIQSRGFLDFVSDVTGIPDLLYDADYIGGGTHENRDGQGLDAHVDFNYHPRTKTHRRLNLIVYLNPEWEEAWGGALELHSDPWNPATNRARAILPLFNRAVIFETTESSWHGFARIALPPGRKALSRKSFAIYLYTKERPVQETAPPHATIYVPDGLPESVVAGHTLQAGDVSDLQSRFTRLRSQLRFLYDREKHFGAQIARVEDALDHARAALRLPLQGYATQPAAPQGWWPDGWAGADFACRFAPQRKAGALELELWVSDHLDDEQVLTIECAGTQRRQTVDPGSRARISLPLRGVAPGDEVELRVRAERSFVPARVTDSADERALAWKLLGMSLAH